MFGFFLHSLEQTVLFRADKSFVNSWFELWFNAAVAVACSKTIKSLDWCEVSFI